MIPDGFVLSDIAMAVMIVLFFGSMILFVIGICIEQVLNSIIRVKRELLEDDKRIMEERYGKCSICGVQIPRNSTEELHYDLEEYGNPTYCKKCWDMKEKDSSN